MPQPQCQSVRSTVPSGMPTQTTTCQRTSPLTYHGHRSHAAAPLLTPASPALQESKSTWGRGDSPGSGSLLPAPTGVQPTLPSGQPLSAGLAHAPRAGILANQESSGSPRARLPRHSSRAALEWGKVRASGWTLVCLSELSEEFSRFLLTLRQKTGCCSFFFFFLKNNVDVQDDKTRNA